MILAVADARCLPLPDASVDAIVCDPPYDLTAGKKGGTGEASVNLDTPYGRARITTGGGGFMGKAWDATGVAFDPSTWHEALRVLKPGGHLLAFGGTRTFHRLTVAIEDAGFEVRDCLMWLYGTGFPKSLDVSKAIDKAAGAERTEVVGSRGLAAWKDGAPAGVAIKDDGGLRQSFERVNELLAPITADAREWDGWGTALKPAWEPIVLARKPLIGTVAANMLAYGTGALNIDGTRIAMSERDADEIRNMGGFGKMGYVGEPGVSLEGSVDGSLNRAVRDATPHDAGRWPANLLLDEESAALLDVQTGERGGGFGARGGGGETYGSNRTFQGDMREVGYGDTGGASRFFYTAKASRSEREAGLEHLLPSGKRRANHHPTVKPVDLMAWLVRLVTPPGGVVLDPFLGSGSTGMAALDEGMCFVGFDLDPDYVALARNRIAHRHVLVPPPPPASAGTAQPRLL
jgi:site-specific DNA-methyltransferase (adenine-specific)